LSRHARPRWPHRPRPLLKAPAAEAPAAEAAAGPFTIGLSNSFVSSEWRTQMIQNMQDLNAELMMTGLTNDLVIESADTDAPGSDPADPEPRQQGCQWASSSTLVTSPPLNTTLEEVVAGGVPVVSIDQAICAEGVINVVIDQKEWAKISMQWLADELGRQG
jgi:ribose transport system substrate-binding protein